MKKQDRNITNQQNKTERWVEEFRQTFRPEYNGGGSLKKIAEYLKKLKNTKVDLGEVELFISQLLSDARREEREHCLKALPKKKTTSVIAQAELVQRPEWNKKYNLMDLRYLVKGYNLALTTAEERIKEKNRYDK